MIIVSALFESVNALDFQGRFRLCILSLLTVVSFLLKKSIQQFFRSFSINLLELKHENLW